MKLSRGEKAVLCITAALLLAMGGLRLWEGRARTLPENRPAAEEAAPSPPTGKRVDINTADEETLMTLPGIGETRAKAIVAYRAEHGPFRYVEELLSVPGIGEGILNELMDHITAGGTEYAENSGG